MNEPQSKHPETDAEWIALLKIMDGYKVTAACAAQLHKFNLHARTLEQQRNEAVASSKRFSSMFAVISRCVGNWQEFPKEMISKESDTPPDYTHQDWACATRAIMENQQLTLERDSLKEQLGDKSMGQNVKDACTYMITLSAFEELKATNQSLIAQMAVMVGALKLYTDDHKPKLGDGCCCLSCGQWTPNDHPEAHDHLDSCVAENRYIEILKTRREIASKAVNSAPLAAKDLLERVERMEKACELSLPALRQLMTVAHAQNMICPLGREAINTLKEIVKPSSTTKQPTKG